MSCSLRLAISERMSASVICGVRSSTSAPGPPRLAWTEGTPVDPVGQLLRAPIQLCKSTTRTFGPSIQPRQHGCSSPPLMNRKVRRQVQFMTDESVRCRKSRYHDHSVYHGDVEALCVGTRGFVFFFFCNFRLSFLSPSFLFDPFCRTGDWECVPAAHPGNAVACGSGVLGRATGTHRRPSKTDLLRDRSRYRTRRVALKNIASTINTTMIPTTHRASFIASLGCS